jgi:hypothetical protein
VFRTAVRWPVWRQPTVALALILAVDGTAALIPALSIQQPISRSDVQLALALGTLSLAYSTFTRSAERVRRALHQGTPKAIEYWDLLAIWGFTAGVLLPLHLMWAVAVAGAVAEWPSRRVAGKARPYRHVYGTAGAILAATATHEVCTSGVNPWLGVALAIPVYIAVGVVLVGAAMLASGQRSVARGLLHLPPYRAEICCLGLAACMIALVETNFGMLIWLSLPAAIGFQRAFTRTRLRNVVEAAQSLPMGSDAWFMVAAEIVNASPVVSIIRVTTADPEAVGAIAQLQSGSDAIGDLGADGLGILLIDCPAGSAESLAARLRTTLRTRNLPAAVAAAGKPRDGMSLGDLLALCEAELVTREAAGVRDQLHREP